MAVAKRMTKEELREDKVVTAFKELAEIAKENSRTLAISAIVIVAAVAGWVLFQQSRTRAEENAAVTLIQAQQLYFAGRYSEAASQFESIQSQYGSTRSAKIVPLLLGNCRLATGDPAAAQAAFQTFAGKVGSDPLLEAAADRGLGGALADQGEMAAAAESYRKAAGHAGNPLAVDDWMSAGAAFLEAGRTDDALAAFQTVVDKFPNSQRTAEARVRLAEARARS